MLIGADGVNSAVRAAVVGDGPPRDNGRAVQVDPIKPP
jgi:2-polyprenyl-6-methoxyphenol hydroxylase-like FAD-dependent oxidoreductase